MKIHTGDEVVIITGKDKGKKGAVLRTLPAKNRVVVAGINMRTKHVKATPQNAGQRLQYEASLDVSNVMLLDLKTKKPTRVGFSMNEKGQKERVARKSGEVISRSAKSVTQKAEKGAPKAEEGAKDAKTKKTDIQRVEKPAKKPFWKRMGFGAGEVAEAGAQKRSSAQVSGRDHSVPEQGQSPGVIGHQRGQ